MPKYRVELSDGRTFVVEADAPPSEQDVLSALGSQSQAPPTKASAAPTSKADQFLADNPALPPMARAGQALARLVKANPVQAGAMAGGALAAPMTGGMSLLPAAGIVGGASALGAGAGQLASGQKPDLGTMATEGALGMTGEGVGRGVTAVFRKLAPVLARAVLKPSKALQQEYGGPELVEGFLRERVPVGQSAQIGPRISESAGKADSMIAQAQAGGAAPVSPREIVKEFRPVMNEAQMNARNVSPGAAGEIKEVVGRAKGLKAQGPVDLVENQALKRRAQTKASTAFRAQDKGAVINDTTAKLDKAVAVGRQKAVEKRVPGIRDVNAHTQNLIGLEDALTDAEARSPGFMGTNPMTWLGAVAPGTGSRAAFAADAIKDMPIPGVFRNALLALLGGSEQ